MFDSPRYVTSGVNAAVDETIQLAIWHLIDSFDTALPQDYMQVFDLSMIGQVENPVQKIVHKQEEPPYCREYIFNNVEAIDAKIFVIDDETHSTMLLAEEY